jgi:hypothetical protein
MTNGIETPSAVFVNYNDGEGWRSLQDGRGNNYYDDKLARTLATRLRREWKSQGMESKLKVKHLDENLIRIGAGIHGAHATQRVIDALNARDAFDSQVSAKTSAKQ